MIKLLKIELKKILTYKIFWIILGLYFLFLALGMILAEFMVNSMVTDINKRMPIPFPKAVIYNFPDIWQNLTFFASIRFVMIFPAIIVIILITNEFANKTIRQNIINGMSKNEFLVLETSDHLPALIPCNPDPCDHYRDAWTYAYRS